MTRWGLFFVAGALLVAGCDSHPNVDFRDEPVGVQFDQSDPFANPDNSQWVVGEYVGSFPVIGGVATRSASVFVAGAAEVPASSNPDVFVLKFDADGELQ